MSAMEKLFFFSTKLVSKWSVPVRFVKGFGFFYFDCVIVGTVTVVLCGPNPVIANRWGPHSRPLSLSQVWASLRHWLLLFCGHKDTMCYPFSECGPQVFAPSPSWQANNSGCSFFFLNMFHSPECCVICALWQSLSLFFSEGCQKIFLHCDGYSNKKCVQFSCLVATLESKWINPLFSCVLWISNYTHPVCSG